jgi:MoxR-like ATPase
MQACVPATAEALEGALASTYLLPAEPALTVWLALKLERPLLVEGPPGVGKTDLARALASVLGAELIRLQCYEGLDEGRALYEWNHGKQLLAAATQKNDVKAVAGEPSLALYDRSFLLSRPLLRALESEQGAVLLLDEVDRADPEFEAFLLEYLAEHQVTIPELGTVKAKQKPITILTTNGTRDLTDALRRRCLYLFLDYPSPSQEQQILMLRVPGIAHDLADQVTRFLKQLRALDWQKKPSISESIDFARALMLLGKSTVNQETAEALASLLAKHEDDQIALRAALPKLLK